MQSFPDLANKDNDAIPARELLAAGIKIRFMDESLRRKLLPQHAPTVVYGGIGDFVFMRQHTCWCLTRTSRKPLSRYWAHGLDAGAGLEFAATDTYEAPSGWSRPCYRAYTVRGLQILEYRCGITLYYESHPPVTKVHPLMQGYE